MTPAQVAPSPTPTSPAAPAEARHRRIWDHVAYNPIHNLWDFQGVSPILVAKRTFQAFNDDNLISRAAELGYYFLFALFPTLLSASAIFGLIVRSGDLYGKLLNYLALVVPHDAFNIVVETFNQTAVHSSSGKITFGLVFALWSASVGFSAIQDTLNIVYKVKETRPYWKVKGAAILVTIVLCVIVILSLFSLLAGTFLSHLVRAHVDHPRLGLACGIAIHLVFDVLALALNVLLFAVIYYFAPDVRNKKWRWFTPGAFIAIVAWIVSSVGLRIYLHYFNSYSVTYGSLGAVIILLTWFYITGLMLLLGAEINSEIEAAVAERKLKASGELPSAPDAVLRTA